MEKSTIYKIAAGIGAVLLIILLLILNPFVGIGAGERGVVLNWGAFNGQILEPGLHIRMPIAQNVIKVNVQTQSLEIPKSEAYTKDLQLVDIQSLMNWNIKPISVGEYYQQYNANFDRILSPRLEAAVKQTIAQYSSEELLHKRGQIQAEIFDIYKKMVPDVVEVTSYSLVNEAFTPEYEKAIEAKQIAQQDSERAENELKKVKIVAEQRIAQATAEAEAIKIQAEAIQHQGGESYVQLQAIAKWNGILPAQMIPGATVPFLNLTK